MIAISAPFLYDEGHSWRELMWMLVKLKIYNRDDYIMEIWLDTSDYVRRHVVTTNNVIAPLEAS